MEIKWDGTKGIEDIDLNPKQWKIELDNTFTSATLEIKQNTDTAIQLFEKCIRLETCNTNIINKRFYALRQIILLKSQSIIADDRRETLTHFQQLTRYYEPTQTTEYISTNDFNNSLRLIFDEMKAHKNIKILLK